VFFFCFCLISLGGMADWFPSYLQRFHGMDQQDAGLAVGGIVIAGGIVGTITGGYLADKFKQRVRNSYLFIPGVATTIGAVFMILIIPLNDQPTLTIVLAALCQICLWMMIGPTTALTANCVHPVHRMRAFAFTEFCQHAFGDAVSPIILGRISDALNLRWASVCLPIVWIIAGIIWITGSRIVNEVEIIDELMVDQLIGTDDAQHKSFSHPHHVRFSDEQVDVAEEK